MVEEQVRSLRTAAALSWSDHVACARVEGWDAYEVLDHLCSSELHMRDGQVLATLFLNRQAVPEVDLFLARDDEDFILLAEGMSGPDLCEHIRAEAPGEAEFQVHDLGPTHRLLSLNGPYSWEVLAGVAGAEAVGLPYLTFFSLGDTLCFRTGKTGEFGYDLLVPRDQAESVSARFEEVGGDFDLTWAGLKALDVCALENWFFNIRREGRFGLTPLELQLQWRVSPRKRFLGSEALEERRKAGIDARVTFVQATGPMCVGQRVFLGDRDVGGLLTASPSPTRGDHLGLALVDLDYACSGLEDFHVETGQDRVPVRTLSPPAIHNRSLFLNPQLHSYFTRDAVDFPPVVPGASHGWGTSGTGGLGKSPVLPDPRDTHV